MIKKLAEDIPAVCAIKNVPGGTLQQSVDLWRQCGDLIQVSACDERNWLEVLTKYEGMGLFLMNSHCTLFQAPGYTPMKDYTELALRGDIARAKQIHSTLEPLRKLFEYVYGSGRVRDHTYHHPVATVKYWEDLIGMHGGPVMPPEEKLTSEQAAFIEEGLKHSPLAPYMKPPAKARR